MSARNKALDAYMSTFTRPTDTTYIVAGSAFEAGWDDALTAAEKAFEAATLSTYTFGVMRHEYVEPREARRAFREALKGLKS